MTEMAPIKGKKWTASFSLLSFALAVYLLTSSFNTIFLTDQSLVKYKVTESIVERHDLNIPDILGVIGKDGRGYSWYGIGAPILSVPFYLAGKIIGRPEYSVAIIQQVLTAATVVLVFRFCEMLGYSRRSSLFASLCYGFASMAWPMSKQPFDHPIEAFFILLSLYFIYKHVITDAISPVIGSACALGFAFLTREMAILALPWILIMVVFYQLKKSGRRALAKTVICFVSAFLPSLCLGLWYNHYRFGSIFLTGFHIMASRIGIDFFSGTPLVTGLKGFLISPGKGFFFYSPVALLLFTVFPSFLRRHAGVAVSFAGIAISYLMVLSKNIYWHGDWAWGPRYLLAVTPLLIIPLAHIFDSLTWHKSRVARVFTVCFIIICVIVQIAAVSVNFHRYFHDLILIKKVAFTVVGAEGTPAIHEPPSDIYFEWRFSPILAQFGFVREAFISMEDYRNHPAPDDAAAAEAALMDSIGYIPDFFWIYELAVYNSYFGLAAAAGLLTLASLSATRLWGAMRGCDSGNSRTDDD